MRRINRSSGCGLAILAADGSTVLYTRSTSGSVVATFDVATGQQTEIVSTYRTRGIWSGWS